MIGKTISPTILTGAAGVAAGIGGTILAGRAAVRMAQNVAMGGAVGITPGTAVGATVASGIMPRAAKGAVNNVFYNNEQHGYGKRGMDSDRLSTSGLVQGLHNRRRTR